MELIHITTNQEGKNLLSARDLHKGLEIKSNFTTWFNRMLEYGFLEDEDYTQIWLSKNGNLMNQRLLGLTNQEMGAKGYTLDYVITLDMAKEISMIQRTEIGKQFRRYFIACEKALKEGNNKPLPQLQKPLEELFSSHVTIKTFTNCSPIELPKLIEDFKAYLETQDTKTKLTRFKSALKGVARLKDQIDAETIHLLPMIQKYELDLARQLHTLENRQNGGIKAHQTKTINLLKSYKQPDLKDYYTLDVHGISNNYLYAPAPDGRLHRTSTYHKWLRAFPYETLPEALEIDPTKPVRMYLAYVAKPNFDIQNLDKATIDTIFKYYGLDDNILTEVISKRCGTCETYEEGSIHFYIENIE